MATITVRNLDDEIQRRLKQRAALHNRSMEAEARDILSSAVARPNFGTAWINALEEFRDTELQLPQRGELRGFDLS